MELILCFSVFLAAMLGCLFTDHSISWALLLALGIFFLLGRKRGYSSKALFDMAWSKIPKTMIVVRILIYIGVLTGLWRSCGTISFFIYHGIRSITPQYFIVVAFLLTVLLSFALGTSFGVVSTAGVVLMALARSGGVNEIIVAGAILSGVYFGDRGAPTSSCASLVAALTETDLYHNVKLMLKIAAVPFALTLLIYTGLSFQNPITRVDETLLNALEAHSVINLWVAVPAILMLILPLFHLPIRRAMAISAAAAFLLSVFVQGFDFLSVVKISILGYHPDDALLGDILSGGGLVSMFTPVTMLPLASLYTGILEGIGALDQMQSVLLRMTQRIGRLPTMNLLSIACAMLLCNQTVVIMMSHQLVSEVYASTGSEHEELAMDIANSGVLIAGLVPWCIACAVPLSMLGVGIEALPYAFYLYLLPVFYLFAKRFFFPSSKVEKAGSL